MHKTPLCALDQNILSRPQSSLPAPKPLKTHKEHHRSLNIDFHPFPSFIEIGEKETKHIQLELSFLPDAPKRLSLAIHQPNFPKLLLLPRKAIKAQSPFSS